MPYDFVQFVLTVLFDLVLLAGIVFVLVACGLEATRRQYQRAVLPTRVLPATPIAPLSLPAAVEPVKMPVRSAQYEYLSA